jgi:hypothetical protein
MANQRFNEGLKSRDISVPHFSTPLNHKVMSGVFGWDIP